MTRAARLGLVLNCDARRLDVKRHPDTGGLRSAQEAMPLEGRIFSLHMSGSFFVDILAEQQGSSAERPVAKHLIKVAPFIYIFHSPQCQPEGIVDKYRFG